eukprot:6190858-Pyramimonas_sp.AAC.1
MSSRSGVHALSTRSGRGPSRSSSVVSVASFIVNFVARSRMARSSATSWRLRVLTGDPTQP